MGILRCNNWYINHNGYGTYCNRYSKPLIIPASLVVCCSVIRSSFIFHTYFKYCYRCCTDHTKLFIRLHLQLRLA